MTYRLLTPDMVLLIHDAVLNPQEIAGLAGDKSIEGALGRVDQRLAYGMVGDVFDLAAAYAVAIAVGHCFNDGNKRTAHQSMDVCLAMNGVEIPWSVDEIGPRIVALAQGALAEDDFAAWLRARA